MSNSPSLPPGFRFHPTDEELILHYLKNRAASMPCPVSIIAEVDIYKFDPWDLPDKAMFGDREWYFFSPRDRKYPNGIRPNRAAASGYWKATGTDKPIHTSKGNENIGVKKALVFYKGRPPKGLKTNWIMHEYRLAESPSSNNYRPMKFRDSSMRLDDWVLCRIYKKGNNLQSVPPLMDREQEGSGIQDNYISNLTNNPQQNPLTVLHKSSSLSELLEDYSLEHLFDNLQPEMPGSSDHVCIMGQPSSNQNFFKSSGNNNLVQQLPLLEPSVPNAENTLKRQRMSDVYSEENNGLLSPSKRRNDSFIYTNFANQFDSPQCNLLNLPFFSQQILLNSHLRLH